MKPKRPSVVALILTYNDSEIVQPCLRTVLASDYPNLSVILVDNGSRTDVVGPLTKAIPGLQTMVFAENAGFAGGFNRAMRQICRERPDADYLWLVSNDVHVTPDTLSRLIDVAEEDEKIGFIGPETFKRGGQGEHDQWITMLGDPENPGDIRLDSERDVRGLQRVEVEFVVGHCLLVRTQVLRTAGLMRDFLIYWEEREWQWRAKQHGWKCFVVPGSLAYHDRDSFGKPHNTYFRTRNYIFFNRLVLARDRRFTSRFVGNLYNELKSAVALGLRRQWSFPHLANFAKGFVHGCVRRVPKVDSL